MHSGRLTEKHSSFSRRSLVVGAASAAGALLAGCRAKAAPAEDPDTESRHEKAAGLIDVHHHVLPDDFRKSNPYGDIEWNLDRALEAMETLGIDKAIASVSPLSTAAPPESGLALKWSRPNNEFLAELVRDNPSRYGAFGSLPLRHVDVALQEIDHVLDELHLDGFILPTSMDGEYLGQPMFDEVLDYLHRRNCVVFVHPVSTPGAEAAKTVLNEPTVDYLFDTTRAIANLLYTGSFDRFHDIRFIFAHAGGAAPYAAGRLKMAADSPLQPEAKEKMQHGVIETLQSLYYDLAQSGFPYSLGGLMELVDPTHVLFGSDYFRVSVEIAQESVDGIRNYRGFDAKARREVERDAALRLFPRLASA